MSNLNNIFDDSYDDNSRPYPGHEYKDDSLDASVRRPASHDSLDASVNRRCASQDSVDASVRRHASHDLDARARPYLSHEYKEDGLDASVRRYASHDSLEVSVRRYASHDSNEANPDASVRRYASHDLDSSVNSSNESFNYPPLHRDSSSSSLRSVSTVQSDSKPAFGGFIYM
jgi:hypothetical protein